MAVFTPGGGWRGRILDREVDLAVQAVPEHAGDHRANRVDDQAGRDDGNGDTVVVTPN